MHSGRTMHLVILVVQHDDGNGYIFVTANVFNVHDKENIKLFQDKYPNTADYLITQMFKTIKAP